jgi:hypothetical protein
MTSGERTWYVIGCIAFGLAYFMKIPAAKALSELPQYREQRHARLGALERPTPTVGTAEIPPATAEIAPPRAEPAPPVGEDGASAGTDAQAQ